jgi:N-acetylglucosamine kinase-like BadF-type ATPase
MGDDGGQVRGRRRRDATPLGGRAPVLAVEGGPEGFTALLATADCRPLATTSGPGADPAHDGAALTAQRVATLVGQAYAAAGLDVPRRARLEALAVFVSGCDLDEESDRLTESLAEVAEARETVVDDAALALLRASTAGDGVAVRCGAVTGCAATRDGVRYRFPALGRAGGDWGGMVGLGEEALWWAARAGDGRGVPTSLARLAPLTLGHHTSGSVARALRRGDLARIRLAELAPVVLRAATAGDAVCLQLVERQAAEVALAAHAALETARLLGTPTDVVLGGELVTADAGPLVEGVRQRLQQAVPGVRVVVSDRAAVTGALDLTREHLTQAGRQAAGAGLVATRRPPPAVRPTA